MRAGESLCPASRMYNKSSEGGVSSTTCWPSTSIVTRPRSTRARYPSGNPRTAIGRLGGNRDTELPPSLGATETPATASGSSPARPSPFRQPLTHEQPEHPHRHRQSHQARSESTTLNPIGTEKPVPTAASNACAVVRVIAPSAAAGSRIATLSHSNFPAIPGR